MELIKQPGRYDGSDSDGYIEETTLGEASRPHPHPQPHFSVDDHALSVFPLSIFPPRLLRTTRTVDRAHFSRL